MEPITPALQREISALGADNDPRALLLLQLAAKLDAADENTSESGLANLSFRFSALLDQLRQGGTFQSKSKLDEIRERRNAKRSNAS